MSNFSIKEENGFTWIRLPRVIGLSDCPKLEADLRGLISEGIKLVLDMADTYEIYSAGIGFIIQARKLAIENKGAVFLVNVSKKVLGIFTALNLDRVFRIYPTDVEFELDNDDLWKASAKENVAEFLFVSQVEDGVGRVIIAGNLDSTADVYGLRSIDFSHDVKWCLFDFSKLDLVDSFGMSELQDAFRRLTFAGCRIAIFGTNSSVAGLFTVFPPPDSVTFYTNAEEAITSIFNGN